eukprot:TRINITY_DN13026_c2_g2_i2.p1 TRINITY_DN13026_c2_g2~~TRINITY_DN13026_c2_g2_i2.p1  ORF type:complete len:115 (-),score=13.73 TRINITY_DN13026_c2_g2_i2:196-516(-)
MPVNSSCENCCGHMKMFAPSFLQLTVVFFNLRQSVTFVFAVGKSHQNIRKTTGKLKMTLKKEILTQESFDVINLRCCQAKEDKPATPLYEVITENRLVCEDGWAEV